MIFKKLVWKKTIHFADLLISGAHRSIDMGMPSLVCQLSATQCPSCLCLCALEGTVLRIPVTALHLIPSWPWNNWAASVATVLFQERVTKIHFDRPRRLETKEKRVVFFKYIYINSLLTHSIPVCYSSFLNSSLDWFSSHIPCPPSLVPCLSAGSGCSLHLHLFCCLLFVSPSPLPID